MTRIPNSTLHLTQADYQTKPWKNGKGTTHDIFLHPETADHSNFDLRIALSPIVEDGVFSSFPEIDRVITLIEGAGLELTFDHSTENLILHDSLQFDSGLAPMGRPVDGSVHVINVMARRGSWSLLSCKVVANVEAAANEADLIFINALSGDCRVIVDGVETLLNKSESLIVSGSATVRTIDDAQMLFAHLTQSAG